MRWNTEVVATCSTVVRNPPCLKENLYKTTVRTTFGGRWKYGGSHFLTVSFCFTNKWNASLNRLLLHFIIHYSFIFIHVHSLVPRTKLRCSVFFFKCNRDKSENFHPPATSFEFSIVFTRIAGDEILGKIQICTLNGRTGGKQCGGGKRNKT